MEQDKLADQLIVPLPQFQLLLTHIDRPIEAIDIGL